MPKQRSALRNRLEYLALRMAGAMVQSLPLPAAQRCGRLLGALLFRLDSKHRRRAVEHARCAFPQWSDGQVRRFVKENFEHCGCVFAEVLWVPKLIRREDWRDFLELGAVAMRIDEWRRRPLLLVSGHIGNWEVGGAASALQGYSFSSVARELDNPLLDRYLLKIRQSLRQKIILKDGATMPVLRELKQNGKVMFLLDQNAGSDGVFVDFFGHQASTFGTVAALSLKLKIPVGICHCHRLNRGGRFYSAMEKVIDPVSYAQYTQEEGVWRLTQDITASLESIIRRHPEQWLWAHRRWKSAPPKVAANK